MYVFFLVFSVWMYWHWANRELCIIFFLLFSLFWNTDDLMMKRRSFKRYFCNHAVNCRLQSMPVVIVLLKLMIWITSFIAFFFISLCSLVIISDANYIYCFYCSLITGIKIIIVHCFHLSLLLHLLFMFPLFYFFPCFDFIVFTYDSILCFNTTDTTSSEWNISISIRVL